MPRPVPLLLCGLALLCVAPGSAPAHPGHSVPLDELIRNSGVIVEGRVESVASAWNADNTQIFTTVDLVVSRTHKGPSPQDRMRLRLLGGTVGDISLAVVGQASFRPDERVLLFLSPTWEQGVTPVAAGEHGKFLVAVDPVTGIETLARGEERISMTDAVTRVRRITAAQQ